MTATADPTALDTEPRAEAERHQGGADRRQGAATVLGRPSLLEGPLQVALAFEAALALLEAEALPDR